MKSYHKYLKLATSIGIALYVFTFFTSPAQAGAPISITSCAQLQLIGSGAPGYVSSSTYVLNGPSNIIDCSASTSGGGFSPIQNFTGTLDGNNNTIFSLYENYATSTNIGLFKDIESGGDVKDLTIASSTIIGQNNVGVLAGESLNGNVQNVTVTGGSVTGMNSGQFIGGLIGNNTGTVSTSSATVAVEGVTYIGGLIGNNDTGAVSGSHASGNVTTSSDNSEAIGGLIGYNANGAPITDSYATGAVNASGNYNSYIGGLIGYNEGNITHSLATGSVTGNGINTRELGGLIGENGSGNVASTSASGTVTAIGDGSQYLGGLVGLSYGSFTNSYATGNVVGTTTSQYEGGFDADMDSGSIFQCYATGNVTGGYYTIGGLVGAAYGTIDQSFATGNIYIHGNLTTEYVGGFAGFTENPISNDYATGNIVFDAGNTPSWIGGFVGENDSNILNSYSTGSISGTNVTTYTGGFIGINSSTVTNSYSTGAESVSTSTNGHFIGSTGSTIANAAQFYQGTPAIGRDTSISGSDALLSTRGYGTDENTLSNFYSTSEPVYAQSSTTTSPWDFTTIWNMHINTFPTFKWFYPSGPSTYSITAGAGAGGSISNLGSLAVPTGMNQSYTIIPANGYSIASVLVDGVSVGNVNTYTFTNVTAPHTISVTFASPVSAPIITQTLTTLDRRSGGGSVQNQVNNLLQNGNAPAATTLMQQYANLFPVGATALPSASSSESCVALTYPTEIIKLGAANNPAQVMLLERYLNTYEHSQLPVDGIYSAQDAAAVIAWQEKYASEVLAPWNITMGTGYVYKTSLDKFKTLFLAQCQNGTQPGIASTSVTSQLTSVSTSMRDLQIGMSGEDVRALQEKLIAKNIGAAARALLNNGATGYFGQRTKSALIEFQQKVGIVPTEGYYGVLTRVALTY